MKVFLTGLWMGVVRLTWGLPDTIIGLLMFLITLPWCKRIGYKGHTILVKISLGHVPGYCWGFEGGIFIFSDSDCIFNEHDDLFNHEFGHNIPQMLIFGPLHFLITTIPSTIRCWWFNYREKRNLPTPDYYSIWFERTASEWGEKWYRTMLAAGCFK